MQARKIVILGGGESGVGAALLAQQKGYDVLVSDRGKLAPQYKAELEAAGIEYEEGFHSEDRILQADEVVKSPGIPPTVPLVRRLVDKGVPVVGEIEFAARYNRALIVGITGSNGKTTTTLLTHHLLATAGFDVRVGGNVGHSFARLVAEEKPAAIYVLELSSFQLEDINTFRPDYAAVLNITPDHLDRYENRIEGYADAKLRISLQQEEDDHFLYLQGDEHIRQAMNRRGVRARQLPIRAADIGADGSIRVGEHRFDLGNSRLLGRHNGLNAAFAAQLALLLGAEPAAVQQGLNSFEPAPHRMERVAEIEGVTWINDSKATNVDAVWYALEAMQQPVIWIAGGTDKGNDYGPLRELIAKKVKALVCLGLDNAKLKAATADILNTIEETRSAGAAVAAAARLAQPGDIVLLSPACASFDLFKNYMDRGDQFRTAVRELKR